MKRRDFLQRMGYAAPVLMVLDVARVARALAWSRNEACADDPDHPGKGRGYGHHCGPGHGHGHHEGGPDDDRRRDG